MVQTRLTGSDPKQVGLAVVARPQGRPFILALGLRIDDAGKIITADAE